MIDLISEHVISFMLGALAMLIFYEFGMIPAMYYGFRRKK